MLEMIGELLGELLGAQFFDWRVKLKIKITKR
jgi:hypothetical protein